MHTVPKSKTTEIPTDAELQDVLKDLQKQAAEIHIKTLEYEIQVLHRRIETPLSSDELARREEYRVELGKKEQELNGCKADYKKKYA